MGWLIVEDLACVLALVMMPVLAGVFGPDAAKQNHSIGSVLADIGWTFVQLGLFVAVMLVVGRRVIPWILERIAGPGKVPGPDEGHRERREGESHHLAHHGSRAGLQDHYPRLFAQRGRLGLYGLQFGRL